MKLNSTLVERTLNQFEAQAIPNDHPAASQLTSLFGDHTFFVDDTGLHIVEPAGSTEAGAQTAQVVKLAEWNENRTSLVAHEPEPIDLVVVLGSEGSDG